MSLVNTGIQQVGIKFIPNRTHLNVDSMVFYKTNNPISPAT